MTKIDKIDLENIKLIIKESKIDGISKIKIKKNDYEIEITSNNFKESSSVIQSAEKKSENKDLDNKEEVLNEDNIIKSPMVGVAYLSADPNSQPYVKVGQHVKAGDTLLLIEAMKTFNEIKAPRSGIIKKIIALNSQPVEYGDTLIIFE
tara:strand:+ start:57 stop:503 length:447 start_codon:yes stop_codon:yes gene_type:complete